MIFSCKVLYIFIVVLYNIIYLSHPKSMADPEWPSNRVGKKTAQEAIITMKESNKSHNFLIIPGAIFGNGKAVFTISSIADDPDPDSAEPFLTEIINENLPVILTVVVDGTNRPSQDIFIENIPDQPNSSNLGGQYYLKQISPGGAAIRGGRSIRSHYRKRKSSRHVSNKKYSMGRRGRSRRVRRSRKN